MAVLRDFRNFTSGQQLQDWQAANALDSVAIFVAQSRPRLAQSPGGDPDLTGVLRNAFALVQATPANPNQCAPGSWGAQNDDVQWGLFAWVHTYEALKQRGSLQDSDFKMIEAAASYLDWVIANEVVWQEQQNGTVNRCGLGVHNAPRLNCQNKTGNDFKNSITNTQFLTSAMLLHPYAIQLKKTANFYLDKAQSEWAWLEYSQLRNSSDGLFAGGLDSSKCLPSTNPNSGAWIATYNQGVLLPGLARLAKVTKNQTLLELGCGTIAGVLDNMASAGVLHELPTCDIFWGGPCRRWAIFKGAFMRGARDFLLQLDFLEEGGERGQLLEEALVAPAGCVADLRMLINASATSVWNHARCPGPRDQWSYFWSGRNPHFAQGCNASASGTNLVSSNVAAADAFNALVALKHDDGGRWSGARTLVQTLVPVSGCLHVAGLSPAAFEYANAVQDHRLIHASTLARATCRALGAPSLKTKTDDTSAASKAPRTAGEVPAAASEWENEGIAMRSLGNHRVRLRCAGGAAAVIATVEWRRPDDFPASHGVYVTSAAPATERAALLNVSVLDISRIRGTAVFDTRGAGLRIGRAPALQPCMVKYRSAQEIAGARDRCFL
jgi:hypothetical protein